MTDPHASPACCWVTETDLHGVTLRVRPRDTCEITALRSEIKERTDGLFRLQAEYKKLHDDVLAEDRGSRIDEMEARFNRELEAVRDAVAVLDMSKEN